MSVLRFRILVCREIVFKAMWINRPPTAMRMSSAENLPKGIVFLVSSLITNFSSRSWVEGRCYPGQGTGTVGDRRHTLLDDGDVLLRGGHLGGKSSVCETEVSRNQYRDSLCRCCRVSPGVRELSSRTERNQSRKLHIGAGEWAVRTSALRAT